MNNSKTWLYPTDESPPCRAPGAPDPLENQRASRWSPTVSPPAWTSAGEWSPLTCAGKSSTMSTGITGGCCRFTTAGLVAKSMRQDFKISQIYLVTELTRSTGWTIPDIRSGGPLAPPSAMFLTLACIMLCKSKNSCNKASISTSETPVEHSSKLQKHTWWITFESGDKQQAVIYYWLQHSSCMSASMQILTRYQLDYK